MLKIFGIMIGIFFIFLILSVLFIVYLSKKGVHALKMMKHHGGYMHRHHSSSAYLMRRSKYPTNMGQRYGHSHYGHRHYKKRSYSSRSFFSS